MMRRRGALLAAIVLAVLAALTGRAAAVAADAQPPVPVFDCQMLGDPAGVGPFGFIAGDWNGDGTTDLAVSYVESGNLISYQGLGRRRFRAVARVDVDKTLRGIAASDLDGDGDLDLAVASAWSEHTSILEGDGHGGFKVVERLSSGLSPFHTRFADFDRDGKVDLLVVNESNWAWNDTPGTAAVYFGIRIGAGQTAPKPLMLEAGGKPSDAAIADFDGKNGPDIAVSNWGSGTVTIFLNNGDRSFTRSIDLNYGGKLAYAVIAEDLDGNGTIDLALPDMQNGGVWTLMGDGHGNFARKDFLTTSPGIRSIAAGDLNRDGSIDLVTADTASGRVSMFLNRGDGTFAAPVALAVGLGPRLVVVGDFDGDKLLDIAATLSRSPAHEVALLFQSKSPGRACVPATAATPTAKK